MLLANAVAPAGPSDPLWPWILVVGLAVLTGVVVAGWVRVRAVQDHAEEQVRQARVRAEDAVARAEDERDAARRDAAQAQALVGHLHAAIAERDRAGQLLHEQALPEVIRQVRAGASPATILADLDARAMADASTRPVLESVTRALWESQRRLAILLGVVTGSADRARAGVAKLRAEVQARSEPYWGGDSSGLTGQIREDLMMVSAGLSRLELLTWRLLTVAEADRVGRNWTRPVRIERIVRAAIGSVQDYRRVQMQQPASTIVVQGRAVNALIQILAELIDNAASFSAPSESVAVTFEETALTVGIHVDDSGLAMAPEQLQQVRERLDPRHRLDIAELSTNRLGLLVVRRAAEPLGIHIDIGPSPRGGTRATVWVPRPGVLISGDVTPEQSASERTAIEPAAAVAHAPLPKPASSEHATVPAPPVELPRRRRGATLGDAPPSTRPAVQPPDDAEATGRRIGQWHAHTRPTSAPPPQTCEET